MNVKDWNQYAARLAPLIRKQIFEAHRGVFVLPDHRYYAVFGNDGYGSDERSKREVELFRSKVLEGERDREEVGFGTDAENKNYTWVLIIRDKEEESPGVASLMAKVMTDTLWDVWAEVCNDTSDFGIVYSAHQMGIAENAIAGFSEQFDYSTLN